MVKKLIVIVFIGIVWFGIGCKDQSTPKPSRFLQGRWVSSAVKGVPQGVVIDYRQNMQLHFVGEDNIDSLFVGWFDGGREFQEPEIECNATHCSIIKDNILILRIKKIDDSHIIVTSSSVPEVQNLYVGEKLEKR